MTLTKIRLGTNEDGTPLYHYAGEHVVLTGPITGEVTLPDGSVVNVTDSVVAADSPEHAAAIAHEVANRYLLEGHPLHDDENPFSYIPPSGDGAGLQMALAGVAANNAALNGLAGVGSTNVIPDVSLHTATPGTTGASENSNTGSYARLACSWNAAASSAMTNSSTLTFTTAGSVAVTHVGTWSSATYGAGNYAIGAALGSSVTAVTITIAAGAISLSCS